MEKLFKVLFLLFLSVLIVNASAMAVTTAGTGLQDFFNSNGWGLDADDDQMTMPDSWMLTNASGATNMIFYHEGLNDNGYVFGIYSIADLQEATVFDDTDTPLGKAVVSFDAGKALTVQYWNDGGLLIDADEYNFTGLEFGFWIGDGLNKYYSDANRNDINNNGITGEEEDLALLVYNADPGSYVFAGDLHGAGVFFDIVIQAESIKPVHTPLPPSIVLLGTALLGFVRFQRKK